VRPDVAAFRELDTLVRNLTEQLAGYRRRALAGESRVRELEHRIGELETVLSATKPEARGAHSLEGGAASSDPSVVAADNEDLRARLAEARERTTQLADRVRFLRQQLMHGTER
jgi:chromosome segregation ATPase